jgi:hypothetical protein
VIPKRFLAALVVAAIFWPIAICVLLAVARLLAALNDISGARVLDWIAASAGILWVITLIALVIVQGMNSLQGPLDPPDSSLE